MSLILVSDVELCPLALPIKGDTVGSLILLIELLEVFVFNISGAADVKKTERDLVFGIGFRQEVLECCPVANCYPSSTSTIGYTKEKTILVTTDFVLQKWVKVSDINIPIGWYRH